MAPPFPPAVFQCPQPPSRPAYKRRAGRSTACRPCIDSPALRSRRREGRPARRKPLSAPSRGKTQRQSTFGENANATFPRQKCLNHAKKERTATFRLRFFGSGRRIRTLTYGVRVRCATITQSRYIVLSAALCRSANKRYYSRNSRFVNRKFSKNRILEKLFFFVLSALTSRWRTDAAAARASGAGCRAFSIPPP